VRIGDEGKRKESKGKGRSEGRKTKDERLKTNKGRWGIMPVEGRRHCDGKGGSIYTTVEKEQCRPFTWAFQNRTILAVAINSRVREEYWGVYGNAVRKSQSHRLL